MKIKRARTDRVPNLELDGLVVDGDHAGAELDADGEVVHGLEPLVGELQQQARLPHACRAESQSINHDAQPTKQTEARNRARALGQADPPTS